ncbi:MAG: hypothetical protein Q9O24_00890 [Gammaproteobacteria bacterium]|nr:hypothetical protein [Gammaproteobacteria bacterium]
MNLTLLLKSLLLSALIFTPFIAEASQKHRHHQQSYTSFARVTHVEPIVRYIEVTRPHKECWDEEDEYDSHENRQPHSTGHRAPIFNGTLGNRIINPQKEKKSDLRQPKTNQQSHSRNTKEHRGRHHQECRVVNRHHREKQIDGYLVHYRYKGENFETRLPYHPGDRMKVRISVTPIRY